MAGWLPWLLLAFVDNDIAARDLPTAELPSAARCAAVFAITVETLKAKSGDPAMTAGFEEDAAALRRIVIAGRGRSATAEAEADAAIAAERKAMKDTAEGIDLKPCYRVKALGPTGG